MTVTHTQLKSLLDRFRDLTVLVVGDFFLDRYLVIDPALAETSLETGLEARQVVHIRNSPGAAGTVTSNLSALGVGRILALGAVGVDGHGFDLKAGLHATGVQTDHLFAVPDRFTPTYTKPILKDTARELERLDVKNRATTPPELEARIVAALRELVGQVHGVMVMDQVQERNCGVITDAVRGELASLAAEHPDTLFFADSRTRIGEFRGVLVKANREEAQGAVHSERGSGPHDLSAAARSLARRNGRPVVITLGPDGILCADDRSVHRLPGLRVSDPIDIVGAGDSVSAGVVSALCAGADLPRAALVGLLASSITIQQIGTTGTASPDQILSRFTETWPEGWAIPDPI